MTDEIKSFETDFDKATSTLHFRVQRDEFDGVRAMGPRAVAIMRRHRDRADAAERDRDGAERCHEEVAANLKKRCEECEQCIAGWSEEVKAAIADRQRAEEIQGELAAELAALRAAKPSPTSERKPDGYAYRYPSHTGGTVLRFNGGEEVNGSKPIESVPYWLGRVAEPAGDVALRKAAKMAVDTLRFDDHPEVVEALRAALAAQEPAEDDGVALDRERLGRALADAIQVFGPEMVPYRLEDRAERVLERCKIAQKQMSNGAELLHERERDYNKLHDEFEKQLAAARAEARKLAVEELRKQADGCDRAAAEWRNIASRSSDQGEKDRLDSRVSRLSGVAFHLRKRATNLESQAKPEAAETIMSGCKRPNGDCVAVAGTTESGYYSRCPLGCYKPIGKMPEARPVQPAVVGEVLPTPLLDKALAAKPEAAQEPVWSEPNDHTKNVCAIRRRSDGYWWQCNSEHGAGWDDKRIRQAWTAREARLEVERHLQGQDVEIVQLMPEPKPEAAAATDAEREGDAALSRWLALDKSLTQLEWLAAMSVVVDELCRCALRGGAMKKPPSLSPSSTCRLPGCRHA